MAPTALATSPTSDNSLLLPPALQVMVLFSIISLVLRYLGSRVSFTGTAQSQATFPVDVELQADAPGSIFVRRSRFWWLSSTIRRLRTTSRDVWLDFTAALMVLGRGTSLEFLPLPVSSRRSSSFSVSVFIRKLFGRARRAKGRIFILDVVGVEVAQPEFSYQAVWVPSSVGSSVAEANIKFATTETRRQTRPCLQSSTTPSPSTTLFDYPFPRDPSGITPAGVG